MYCAIPPALSSHPFFFVISDDYVDAIMTRQTANGLSSSVQIQPFQTTTPAQTDTLAEHQPVTTLLMLTLVAVFLITDGRI